MAGDLDDGLPEQLERPLRGLPVPGAAAAVSVHLQALRFGRADGLTEGPRRSLKLLGRLLRRRDFLFGRSSGCRLRLRGGRAPGCLLWGGPCPPAPACFFGGVCLPLFLPFLVLLFFLLRGSGALPIP